MRGSSGRWMIETWVTRIAAAILPRVRRSEFKVPVPQRPRDLSRLLARIEHRLARCPRIAAAGPVKRARADPGEPSGVDPRVPEARHEVTVPLECPHPVEAVHESLAEQAAEARLVAVVDDSA